MRTVLCACAAVLAGMGGLGPSVRAEQQVPPPPASRQPSDEPGRVTERRDPFVRPARETAEPDAAPGQAESRPLPRPEGLQGLSTDEITLRGVLNANGRDVALVEGPDRKHYAIRPGDRLRDGVVQAITPGRLVMIASEKGPAVDQGGQLSKSAGAQREGH